MLMRLKKNKILRNMCVNTTFLKDQLIQPIFVSENIESKKEIPGIPNNFVMNLKESIQQIELDLKVIFYYGLMYVFVQLQLMDIAAYLIVKKILI